MVRNESGANHALFHSYVQQTTTHGIQNIGSSHRRGKKAFWVIVFLASFSVCIYHCSYLVMAYLAYPKVTITEELDADVVEFPSLTVCNLNLIKKDYALSHFEMTSSVRKKHKKVSNSSSISLMPGGDSNVCSMSEDELLQKSAVDLSDTWLNVGVTKDNLLEYGHKYTDLVVQCTYNNKDCSDNTEAFFVEIKNVTTPMFGLCHTLSIKNTETNEPSTITKGGTTQGIRLTLNIERSKYWDLISSEYGVRLLVHPQGTYPTLQRGGIIVGPGRSIHIGVKRKVTLLLPGIENSCETSFLESRIAQLLQELDLDFDLTGVEYTYENALLFRICQCLDEQPRAVFGKETKWKLCDPCNKTEAECRNGVLRNFNDMVMGNICDEICEPSCSTVRYDISLSESAWPNLNHQRFVINRSIEQWSEVLKAMDTLEAFSYDGNNSNKTYYVNDLFFRENLLRVHLFVEEMIYTSIREIYSYTLPNLLADLGGCLGLYLGVSVISIIEFVNLCGSWTSHCLLRGGISSSTTSIRKTTESRRQRNRIRRLDGNSGLPNYSTFKPSLGYFKKRKKSRNNSRREEEEAWKTSAISPRDPSYFKEDISRKDGMHRF